MDGHQKHDTTRELRDEPTLSAAANTFANDTATSHVGVRSVTVASAAKKTDTRIA